MSRYHDTSRYMQVLRDGCVVLLASLLQFSPWQGELYPWTAQWLLLAVIWFQYYHSESGYVVALVVGLLWDAATYAPFGSHALALIIAAWWQSWQIARPRVGLHALPIWLAASSVVVFTLVLLGTYSYVDFPVVWGGALVTMVVTMALAYVTQLLTLSSNE